MFRKITVVAALLAVFTAGPVSAENLRLIVPYSAGGSTDRTARVLQPALQEKLGASVIVDNKPGAGGMIGGNALAQATPDGNTVGLFSVGHILTALTKKDSVPYDAVEDFTPIAMLGLLPAVLVTRQDLDVKNIDELFALSKKQKINFGSSGVGTASHLGGEFIAKASGGQFGHIPYGGSGPAIVDLLAGTIDMYVADIPAVVGHVNAGKLNAVAIFGPDRSPALPDVSTSAEQGHADLRTGNFFFVVGPKGIPADVTAKLEKAVIDAANDPKIAKTFAASGLGKPDSAKALDELLRSENTKWKPFVEALNLANK